MNSTEHGGIFVISIDFELAWGVLDHTNFDNYRNNILLGRDVFLQCIDNLSEKKITSTVAIVGLLLQKNKAEILSNIPKRIPNYAFKNSSPFPDYVQAIGDSEIDDKLHYGKSIIDKLKKHRTVEIATHTYSHYYCLDDGHDSTSFRDDLDIALTLCIDNDIPCESIILPRNQINMDYLKICRQKGILAYRGNEKSRLYNAGVTTSTSTITRLLRIIDAYINISGHHTYPTPTSRKDLPTNIPSSRFLRPIKFPNKVSSWLKIKRIKNAMTHAAKNNQVFHLWWHPHNFGAHSQKMLSELSQIANHYTKLKDQYGMKSMTMKEVSKLADNNG